MSDRTESTRARKRREDPLVGVQLGQYRLEQRIGEGGLGRVFLGVQVEIGLRVAVKVLGHGEAPPSAFFRERFLKEAQALARVGHPNVVRILGYAAGPPVPYLVMELVEEAVPLVSYLLPECPRAVALHVLRQLLNAVEAVHAAQLVHRDLKPSNILVQSVAGEPHHLRLLDFGLAKFLEGGRHTRVTGGTPPYMAPEQMSRGEIGPAADIYAIGTLAAELLIGRRLYAGLKNAEILARKASPEFRPTTLLAEGELSPELRALVDRCTAFAPADRFAEIADVRAALERALGPSGTPTPTSESAAPPMAPPDSTAKPPEEPPVPATRPESPTPPVTVTVTERVERPATPRLAPILAATVALAAAMAFVADAWLRVEPETPPPVVAPVRVAAVPAAPSARLSSSPPPAVAVVVAVPESNAPGRAEAAEVRSSAVLAGPSRRDLLRAALKRCDCARARTFLGPGGDAREAGAVAACRPPMLGQPCRPGRLP